MRAALARAVTIGSAQDSEHEHTREVLPGWRCQRHRGMAHSLAGRVDAAACARRGRWRRAPRAVHNRARASPARAQGRGAAPDSHLRGYNTASR